MNFRFRIHHKTIFIFILFLFDLILSTNLNAKNYKGAELRTKESYLYGRFEVRMKPAEGSGFLSSFFTFHDFQNGSSEWNEIDLEILGRYAHNIQVTSIGPYQNIRPSHQWIPFNPHLDFHVYAFEWTPDYIAWFVDGEEIYRQDDAFIQDFKYPQKIMMNIWNPEWEGWAGTWFDASLPVFSYYDYVRYAAYTPDSGNCGTNNNFTLLWKDDFDSLNSVRWERATHTFSGNKCDFTPENIVFKNGTMILCLTDNTHLGFVDQMPPTLLYAWAIDSTVYLRFNENLELNSATNLNNFRIPGITIKSAQLLNDRQTVRLFTSTLNDQQNYNIAVLGIKDLANPPNKQLGQVLPIKRLTYLDFPIRINCGGNAVGDYLPDQPWQPDRLYGHQDGSDVVYNTHPNIKNSTNDSLYWSELNGFVSYKIRVPSGRYRLRLHLAENTFNLPDQRVFDIIAEGKVLRKNLDPVAQYGFGQAITIQSDSLWVTDGELDLYFVNRKGASILNAIELLPVQTSIAQNFKNRAPEYFTCLPNYPNPFNNQTVFPLIVKRQGNLRMQIYNLTGQLIYSQSEWNITPGKHLFRWKANAASGIYLAKFTYFAPNRFHSETRKIILLK